MLQSQKEKISPALQFAFHPPDDRKGARNLIRLQTTLKLKFLARQFPKGPIPIIPILVIKQSQSSSKTHHLSGVAK